MVSKTLSLHLIDIYLPEKVKVGTSFSAPVW